MKIAKTFVGISLLGVAASTTMNPVAESSLSDLSPTLTPTVSVEDVPDGTIIETKPVVRIYDLPYRGNPNVRAQLRQNRDFDSILSEIDPDNNEDLPLIINDQRNFTDAEKTCLAKNIYFEARNESIEGQIAVALVTLNRVYSGDYPNDVCDVIYDHMQFSWYWDGLPDRPQQPAAFERAKLIATVMLTPELAMADFTGGATHYHAQYVAPCWAQHMQTTVTIEAHIFYKEDPNGGVCVPKRPETVASL